MPSPIDVDDLLAEILLRLAPLPSSLPHASLVCARWRRIVTDPDFLRRFRAHHWKPLGVFLTSSQSGRRDFSFSFVSDPGDSIRHERFSVPPVRAGAGDDDYTWVFLGCRHGRVLLIDRNLHGYSYGHQMLAPLPPDVYANHRGLYLTTLANGGGLSLIVMSANLEAQLWERTPDCDGAATARWMLRRTIELDKLLSLRPGFPECRRILGVEGDHNVMFVSTYRGVFMVHLESMRFEKIFETNPFSDGGTIHPFTTLYAPGTC
ncbi:unnamed protein product [Urochloa decumbens]|uniref:F-box domain-containing protein n=1 Tax=Urochloa decumbens TaxID=240449 RepID=A0ABC9HBT3_9POAL